MPKKKKINKCSSKTYDETEYTTLFVWLVYFHFGVGIWENFQNPKFLEKMGLYILKDLKWSYQFNISSIYHGIFLF